METESIKAGTSESSRLIPKASPSVSEDNSNLPNDPKKNTKSFYKTVEITNPDEVKRIELVRQMKQRFAKKSRKWERRATSYSRFSFSLTFFILLAQLVQMILLPLKSTLIPDKYYTMATALVTATAALLAGLQLKLKLHQKIAHLQKGVKIYNRMQRSASYYLMMTENGGLPANDNTILMWKQALTAEIEDVPVVRQLSSF